MPTDKIDTEHTHNSASETDLSHSSDPNQELSKLLICRGEISRLESLERGLLLKSTRNRFFTIQSDGVEARQARKDASRIRKCLAIVVGIGLLAGFAMVVLAVVKQMKGRNVQFVGESGAGNTTLQNFDRYIVGSFETERELESEDSGDESYSESSESEYQQEDTPALVAPPAEQGGPPQVVVPPPRTTISRQELAQHNTADDLWTELYGIVYDLTNFVGSHPGGSRVIVNIAGKGGLQAFESFHKRNTLQNFDRYIVGSFEIEQQGTPALAPPALVAPPALAPPAEQGGPQVSYSESYSESSESEDQQDTPALAPPAEQGGPQVVAPPPAATTTISRQELAQHNTADGDLWTELFGIVYDLTNFVGSHPGGSRVIVNIAGKGGLQAFESFHKRNTLQKFDRYIVGPLE